MPNGVTKNLVRLEMACAMYHQRFGSWPSEARMAPVMLWDIAHLVELESFESIASHLALHTRPDLGLTVSGLEGAVEYGQEEFTGGYEETQRAAQWLGAEVRSDLREHD